MESYLMRLAIAEFSDFIKNIIKTLERLFSLTNILITSQKLKQIFFYTVYKFN
jgi:hypothetical protein